MTTDYGQTIHLPKTDFPRRAGLAQKEPEILARWEKMGLYDRQRESCKGKKKFILHMGPPFANGNIHLGHVLSTVLKDVVCRSYQMLGYDAPLVPGFDCHGLPIEWKIEEDYRSKGKNSGKDEDRVEFLKACRDFAAKWVGVQTDEFKRLGILGDWKNPYKTMDRKSEATIAATVHEFLRNGGLYRGSKPVMWSVPEQTALAEAEIEYKDMTSDTVWVKFPVKSGGPKELQGASVVIWTTTPWTLPGNRAIGFGAEIEYALVTVKGVEDTALLKVGDKVLVAAALKNELAIKAGVTWLGDVSLKGSDLTGVICHHPLHAQGYTFDVPLLHGDFVTTDAGTGFVHIAPGHGEDDYRLVLTHNQTNPNKIEIPDTVKGDGKYYDHVPLFAGLEVYTAAGKKGPANKLVMNAIAEAGNLVAKGQVLHSYPHSWRSKAPVIFRNTPQWFVSMEKNGLRKKALGEIEKTRFVPERGRNRIGAMVEGRGDWCLSRQRVWGVPLAIFYNADTLEPLRDEKVLKRIIDIFETEGSESWYERPPADFLGPDYNPGEWIQVRDIVDVWMESGVTQDFVLKQRPELHWPADLYLEGSDQHRGWFQSSLLVATGTQGAAPYKAVLTHGFILDEKGYKMSKSQGNVTAPAKLMEMYGADILRLWAVSSDYTEDTKFGENILKFHADVYRRIRGTFCYLLGSLDGSGEDKNLSDLDKYILHRVYEIDRDIRKAIDDFDFKAAITLVNNFCSRELSAFYFDVCKDALYCEAVTSIKRKAIVHVLDQVFVYLCHWLSPVLAFTTEEAWLNYKGVTMEDAKESIHLSVLPEAPKSWNNPKLGETWEKVIEARSVVTGALEVRRAAKEIGASLEAAPKVYVADTALASVLKASSFADICITSGIQIESGAAPADAFTAQGVEGVAVVFAKADGQKCERCWKYTTDTGAISAHPAVCKRCGEAVERQEKSLMAAACLKP
jgi:isoleucyl-tRNA synthetase